MLYYNAKDIAKYVVNKCIDDEHPISNLQLQKILYYIQRAYLKQDRCAFTENIEAWQFGPVVPCVYYIYCGFGSMRICVKLTPEEELQPEDKAIIDPIVESKRDLMPWDLVNDTHREGGAWNLTFKNGEGLHAIIPMDLIKSNG